MDNTGIKMKNRQPYTQPDIEVVNIHFENDILASSVENFSSYIDGTGDDWGEPIIDPDEPIDW